MCSFWQAPSGTIMMPDNIVALALELDRLHVDELVLVGGEPFIYPDLYYVLESCIAQTSRLAFAFITNASIDNSMVRNIVSQPRVTRVHISLDALSERGVLAVRGRSGWYAKALSFIQMVRHENPTLKIVINAIINKHNAIDLLQYFHIDCNQVNYLNLKGDCPELEVSRATELALAWQIDRFLVSNGGRSDSVYIPILGEEHRLYKSSRQTAEEVWARQSLRVPCVLVQKMSYIDLTGQMYPCNCLCHAERCTPFGNVFDAGFAAVWRGEDARNFRIKCSTSQWAACLACDPANRLHNMFHSAEQNTEHRDTNE